ncbi:PhzF family phenazine biosynthesis protein [Tenacibaculum sp. M341]|uniref:PhzF family phenazine biosynthesis protein n=1 Tax=Tenacibaculum sp. M341 TaxID=2530339 RepID=UPI001FB463D0|nr:PhzF family phenazine biosynthesis protein [Tenacibaculum sp. M341]
MKTTIETYIVDSFTNESFKGNPAGVCILEEVLSEDQMQLIAKELGLSETAFVKKIDEELDTYSIRFFSPKMEIPLCGHATLASSKVILEKNPKLKFLQFLNINELILKIEKNESSIKMNFPVYNTEPQNVPKELLNALGIETINNSVFNKETNILLLEIEDSTVLKELTPNFERLKASHNNIDGVLVTALSNQDDFDFESRYFWPWSGTNEDPVTGATHTFLTKYWGKKLHKKTMRSFQCSERTGFMTVALLNENNMTIESEAQIVFKGELMV